MLISLSCLLQAGETNTMEDDSDRCEDGRVLCDGGGRGGVEICSVAWLSTQPEQCSRYSKKERWGRVFIAQSQEAQASFLQPQEVSRTIANDL
eukprot:754141-Hanusia_phi.AAC.1